MTARDIVMGAAGNSGDSKTYVEDVFSTYLYTGNGSTQTITNGIDLAGQGGMVWTKSRNQATTNNLYDTARGVYKYLQSNNTNAQGTSNLTLTSFNSNGFTVNAYDDSNVAGSNAVSWTFRKAPKFFDVVTWTGNGVNNRQISHSLGIAPGMVIVKRTSGTENWPVYHRSVSAGGAGNLYLNLTLELVGAKITNADATTFTVIADTPVNEVGSTYVAYLFAHDTTTDGLIQCGSYTGNGSSNGPTINLGWEPQYVLVKKASDTGNWRVFDNMRGMSLGTIQPTLIPNLSDAESSYQNPANPLATGFQVNSSGADFNSNGGTYIYMAIRRGPMKTPTDGTKVFSPVTYTGSGGANTVISTTVRPDMTMWTSRNGTSYQGTYMFDRLRGTTNAGGTGSGGGLKTALTDAENPNSAYQIYAMNNNSVQFGSTAYYGFDYSGLPGIMWNFTRAPGFFDEVCGNWAAAPLNHNLGVVPELIIGKTRTTDNSWYTWTTGFGIREYVTLNQSNAKMTYGSDLWITPTSTQFGFQNFGNTTPAVFYLFASCPGVSKVGSYTGNGSSQTINCGFTNGARFVLIKRTDSTGDWYVWDTARGIVASNDPHLSLNTTAAEVTSDDTIDPDSTGFVVNQVSATNVNVSGASYIYLAIA